MDRYPARFREVDHVRTFEYFPKLPTELRLLVWKQYALPKGPILFVGSRSHSVSGKFGGLAQNIIRVNRETRASVLGRRECYILAADEYNSRKINTGPIVRTILHGTDRLCFMGQRFHGDGAKHAFYGICGRYVFVDWEKDAFHLPLSECYKPFPYHGLCSRIQNLVVPILPQIPEGRYDVLLLRLDSQLRSVQGLLIEGSTKFYHVAVPQQSLTTTAAAAAAAAAAATAAAAAAATAATAAIAAIAARLYLQPRHPQRGTRIKIPRSLKIDLEPSCIVRLY
ncbi:hypothetical protein GGR53DRAFT_530521 [Hypoxylon sp. FL1150]|nr:hypothetical protein GGR53DRAFT_530521 [Hypoxylon sp. FL1150]